MGSGFRRFGVLGLKKLGFERFKGIVGIIAPAGVFCVAFCVRRVELRKYPHAWQVRVPRNRVAADKPEPIRAHVSLVAQWDPFSLFFFFVVQGSLIK